ELAHAVKIQTGRPSAKELTKSFVRQFNADNPVPSSVRFYAIAGSYFCPSKVPQSNIAELFPNDVVVWRGSVFAIALQGMWTYPSKHFGSCLGDHRGMRSNEVNHGGSGIFHLFVSPLLRGQMPDLPAEPQTYANG